MRLESRLSTAAIGLGLAALGSLVTHQIAYVVVLAAGVMSRTDMTAHGHLATQWALVTPIAVLATSGFIVRQVQRLGLSNPLPVRSLAMLTSAMFVAQEMIESVVAGRSALSVCTSPAVILGVILTPLVAFALSRILGGVTDLVRRFIDIGHPHDVDDPPSFGRPTSARLVPLRVSTTSAPRGPPARR